MLKWLTRRSTGEIMILVVAFTVCGYVIVNGAVIAILVIKGRSNESLLQAARQITDIINTLIGLLAGFLAGKTDLMNKDGRQDPEK
jgi:hypothetical protein